MTRPRSSTASGLHREPPETVGYTLVTRRLIQTPDCHDMGALFGGALLAWADEAASIFCRYQMGMPRVVTRAIRELEFHSAGQKGETVSLFCRRGREGRSSLGIDILGVVADYSGGKCRVLLSASTTWVGLDKKGKPRAWK